VTGDAVAITGGLAGGRILPQPPPRASYSKRYNIVREHHVGLHQLLPRAHQDALGVQHLEEIRQTVRVAVPRQVKRHFSRFDCFHQPVPSGPVGPVYNQRILYLLQCIQHCAPIGQRARERWCCRRC
jgi:hypothetical protein